MSQGWWHFWWVLQAEHEWSNDFENSGQYPFNFLKGSQTKLEKKRLGFPRRGYSVNEAGQAHTQVVWEL